MSTELPLAGKRIGLLSAWASRLGGGVFEAVLAQDRLIAALGGEAHVFALEDQHSSEDRARFGHARVHTFRVAGPGQIGFAPGLVRALIAARLDCLHLHGIWMYPSLAASRWAASTGLGHIISPHGMLDPWITARGRWKKALARAGYERSGWRKAGFFHALTSREARDIERESGRSDSVVIANAGPSAGSVPQRGRGPHFVYIGRIHPKKNLHALLEAWSLIDKPADARLTLAGWGEAEDVTSLRAAVGQAGPSAQFIGPVYGEAKQQLLGQAGFLVLPSHSEGLPMAILEGWSAATPAIMTAECNLGEGFEAGAAIECGYDAQRIVPALQQALGMTAERWLGMAQAARALANGPFSEPAIAARWAEAYRRVMGMGSAR